MVRLNLCPFAKAPLGAGDVRFVEAHTSDVAGLLAQVLHEAEQIRDEAGTTSLIVVFEQPFDDFLDLVGATEALLDEAAPELQLAAFHPDWVFADSAPDDPANRVNRAPHPVLHLLRRQDVARAIETHPDTRGIPARNAALLRDQSS